MKRGQWEVVRDGCLGEGEQGTPSRHQASRDNRREEAQQESGGERKAVCLGELKMPATPESGDDEDYPLPLIPQGSAQVAPFQDVLCPPGSLGGWPLSWV